MTACAAPARTRHIHRRWYFIRYYADAGKLGVKEIKGVQQPRQLHDEGGGRRGV